VGRPARYSTDTMLDAAGELVRLSGPAGLSMTGVAERIGAPSGSIYHRFASRDVLAASLWLRAVDRFQDRWASAADRDDPVQAACSAARHVVQWSRSNLVDAQILMLYRSTDFVPGDWPAELVQRNAAQRARVEATLGDLAVRLGAASQKDRRRVRFAVIDIPYGAVRQSLARGRAPEADVESLVEDAVAGVLAQLSA
jgi:AcrR family transcriptional regulator